MLVSYHKTAPRHNAEDLDLNHHRSEDVTYRISIVVGMFEQGIFGKPMLEITKKCLSKLRISLL
jgi:hypothetical protein